MSTLSALTVALILTAPLGAPALMAAQWSSRSLLAILALGCLGTAVANVVMAVAAGRLGPTRASATTFLIPVVAEQPARSQERKRIITVTSNPQLTGGLLVRVHSGEPTQPQGMPIRTRLNAPVRRGCPVRQLPIIVHARSRSLQE